MRDQLQEIARLAAGATTEPTATAIPGVLLIRGEVPVHQLAALYEPMVGFVVQGGKTMSIGAQVLEVRGPAYFVIPAELPATATVQQGRRGEPYLSVALRLREEALLGLLGDLPPEAGGGGEGGGVAGGFVACAATAEFVEAWVRMLRLLEHPRDIAGLAPVYEREILYRVLTGPEGWRLRQWGAGSGGAARLRAVMQAMRTDCARPVDVGRAAARCAMSRRTFHRQFKQMTGLSPVQYQKQLRLMEARKLLVFGGSTAAEAAFRVGYESVSQFHREYVRLFGQAPGRDAAAVRGAVLARGA